MDVRLTLYNPEDLLVVRPETAPVEAAFNQVVGPAFTLWNGKGIIGCGGMRIRGIGEPWIAMKEEERLRLGGPEYQAAKFQIVKAVQTRLNEIIRAEGLWRIWCEVGLSDNFMEHCGLKKTDAFVWQAGQGKEK